MHLTAALPDYFFYFAGHKTVSGLMHVLRKVLLLAVVLNKSGTCSKFPLVPVLQYVGKAAGAEQE